MSELVVNVKTKPAKRVFTENIGLREVDGRYFVYKVQKRLDANIYWFHVEQNKIVLSKIHEEVTPDEMIQYLSGMKDKLEKLQGAEAAQNAYDHHMKAFKLLPDSESDGAVDAEFTEIAAVIAPEVVEEAALN